MIHTRDLNDIIMERSAELVGSPSVFYVILILAIGSLLWQRPTNVQGWLLWGCTILFQGAALSPIQYTGAKTSKKIDAMYAWMQESHAKSHELISDLHDKHVGGKEHLKIGGDRVAKDD